MDGTVPSSCSHVMNQDFVFFFSSSPRVSMPNFCPQEAECDSLISVMRPDLTQPTHEGIPKDSFRDILFL
jgi:hypothetical protein